MIKGWGEVVMVVMGVMGDGTWRVDWLVMTGDVGHIVHPFRFHANTSDAPSTQPASRHAALGPRMTPRRPKIVSFITQLTAHPTTPANSSPSLHALLSHHLLLLLL